jgi:DNA-directed RNA polymerase specialized sigma54-like protein
LGVHGGPCSKSRSVVLWLAKQVVKRHFAAYKRLYNASLKGQKMDIDEIRAALADRRLDIVSEGSGVHRSTIARIRDGKTVPTFYVVQKLVAYFEANK